MPYINVDGIAEKLMYLGRTGKSMPPSWDGAGISVPVMSGDGQYIGKVLPGKGFYSEIDLKYVGITKSLPFVYEKTPVQRLVSIIKSERRAIAAMSVLALASTFPRYLMSWSPLVIGAITAFDDIVASRQAGKGNDVVISKLVLTTVTQAWATLFLQGGFPGVGTYTNIPTGAVMDNTNPGAWSLGLANPGGTDKKYLLTFGYTSNIAVNLSILADLLVGCGNIDANVNTAQTVTSAALTRYTSGAGVLMTMVVTTQLGGTASNVTMSYTNQAGTSGRTSVSTAMTTSAIVGRMVPVVLGFATQFQGTDYGVRTVASVTLSAAMTAGILALDLYFPLAFIPGVSAGVYLERDSNVQIDGLTELVNASGVLGCLNLYVNPNTTTVGPVTAFIKSTAG